MRGYLYQHGIRIFDYPAFAQPHREYATDLIFETPKSLQSFYPLLLESLIQTVKPEDIATFLGRGNYQREMDNRRQTRWLGGTQAQRDGGHSPVGRNIESKLLAC